ncbi:S8 family serine peptidase [Neotamlana laminarinivorans]|uniref:S8 family serine peptidase n=1 Tax=Neotamlana laminarinivorans TaxID=2883124 RepID=A0A9X1L3C8_9FLAO|nr:S8 family serine peptidase [Tamlana laminarinivorans]MCB4798389.1 S8 family serine peptidase [Tamlana laminarinivorans]
MKKTITLTMLCFFYTGIFFAQTKLQVNKIKEKYDINKLNQLKENFKEKAITDKTNAVEFARRNNLQIKTTTKDGRLLELQRIVDGKPIYYSTFNVTAAVSTRTNHLQTGGSLGLNLMGQNMIAYVWDGGVANIAHQEYDGSGGNNRFSIGDGTSSLNFHAEHVTGTIIASGYVANAEGMAPQASAIGSDWNDDKAEATSATSNGMLLSNHSYGYAFRNQFGQVQLPQYFFGGYIDESRDWDEIMFNAPNYLMVVAAGNDGEDDTAVNNPTGGSGWDKLTGHSTSKNNLVVANAQDANIDSNGNLISVTINSSSSEGPTDDMRIKPDITGNGTGLYSTFNFASYDSTYGTNYADGNITDDYASITGTSMASPNVTGSLLLLQQHYNNLNGSFMKAATLKGLALHTADDAGASGPDAVYGWGLLNAKTAAEVISAKDTGSKIQELTLTSGQTYSITVDSDGVSPLLASISWTDRAGTAVTSVNSTTPVLVNDLDIRVTQGSNTYLPYMLTGPTSNNQQDNTVDPYERVDVVGATGTYTITVTHKGSLTGGSQNYSLIISGLSSTPVVCNATVPTAINTTNVIDTEAFISWDPVPGATYDVRYRIVGTTSWTTIAVNGASTTLTGLTALTDYEVQVRSNCTSGSSAYSSSVSFSTTEMQLNYCTSNGSSVSDEYIGRVEIGNIDNSSGASSSGYADFTTISTGLTKGSTTTITVTPTWTGTVYSEGYAVFIDYNKDGDFEDSGETVWTQSATQAASVSGSFTVPASAITGSTTMRVVMQYNTIPSSCGSYDYGETEDYTVNLITGTADITAPVIALIGDGTINLEVGATYNELGATATDETDGDISSSIVITGTVNTSVAGTYTRYYNVSDAAGNAATEVTRSVIITQPSTGGCTGGISSFPYSESFESGDGWTQATGDDGDWVNDSNGTPSSNTGPSSGADGSYYMFLEASTNGSSGQIGTNAIAILESPCFDLSGESSAAFTFQNHMYGSSVGSLELEASTDGTNWTSLWFLSGNQGDQWNIVSIDLNLYLGQTVSLRFVGTTGSSWSSDIAIDDLEITTVGTTPVVFPDPTKKYYIDSAYFDYRIAATGESEDPYTTSTSTTGADVEWVFIDKGNGYWHIQRAAGGSLPRLRTDNSEFADMQGTAWSGTYTYYELTEGYIEGSYFVTLPDGPTNYKRLQVNSNGIVRMVSEASALTWESITFTEAGSISSTVITSNLDDAFENTKATLSIYPNPVTDLLFINTGSEIDVKVTYRIVNMVGQIVKQGKNSKEVDVSRLDSGVYFIEIKNGENIISKKFIKQ